MAWGAFRRLPLTAAESPLVLVPATVGDALPGPLLAKLEGALSTSHGASKVRALEFELARAVESRADVVVTAGPPGSNHLVLAGRHAAELGLRAILIRRGRPSSSDPSAVVSRLAASTAAIELDATTTESLRIGGMFVGEIMRRLTLAGRRPFFIPFGCGSAVATLGYVRAGRELSRQFELAAPGLIPEVVVPVGTGALAAGLAVGLATSPTRGSVVGVPAPAMGERLSDRVASHVSGLISLLRRSGATAPRVGDAMSRVAIVDAPATDRPLPRCVAGLFDGVDLATSYVEPAARWSIDAPIGKGRGRVLWCSVSRHPDAAPASDAMH
ncbi:MAG: pyridoxal-phosphate dependent enzyme [bacterium]|nr:pyridoxal-phosphate dependent enzyme [bacterium]